MQTYTLRQFWMAVRYQQAERSVRIPQSIGLL